MQLSTEDREEMMWLLTHRSFKHVLGLIDEVVSRIEQEVISFPVTGNPQDAMLALNNKRHQAIGAMALKNALKSRISELKYSKEGDSK